MSKNVVFWLPLTVGETIKVLRTRAKLTPRQLAKKAQSLWGFQYQGDETPDISARTITDLEAGYGDPLMSQLIAIGEVVGYHLDVHVALDPKPAPVGTEPAP